MSGSTASLDDLVGGVPVIPVIVIERVADALPLARALVRGGLPVFEITLRTAAAMDAVRAIVAGVPDAIVGVGSVIDPAQFVASRDAGARFAVSPGATAELDAAALAAGMPWLPGAQTASEVLALRARGRRFLKLFPAASSGGVSHLRALGGPIPDVRFCPTGGVTPENAREYLALPNVACVGGSWLAPAALVSAGRWDEIAALASAARALRS